MFSQDAMPQDEYFEWEDIVLHHSYAHAHAHAHAQAQDQDQDQAPTDMIPSSTDPYSMPALPREHLCSQSRDHGRRQLQTQSQRTCLPASTSGTAGVEHGRHRAADSPRDQAFTTFTADMSSTIMSRAVRTQIQTSFAINWTLDEKQDSDGESPIDFPSYDAIDLGLGGHEDATPIVSVPDIAAAQALPLLSPRPVRVDPARGSAPEADLGLGVGAAATYARDCAAVAVQPSENVNYLLHAWREPDVAASWRHLVSRRRTDSSRPEPASTSSTSTSRFTPAALLEHAARKHHNNARRLENASWRTWARLRFGLRTVEPQTINWSKHCDDTCLHGPFVAGRPSRSPTTPSHLVMSRERTPSRESGGAHGGAESPTAPRPPRSILKKPGTAEILRRGSLPTLTRPGAPRPGPVQQASPPNQPLPPLSTPPEKPARKRVTFRGEVRQYLIVTPVGDRKTQRMVKKARSTSLLPGSPGIVGSQSHIDPRSALRPTPAAGAEKETEGGLERAPSYWSPQSLWRYGAAPLAARAEEGESGWVWPPALPSDPEPGCSDPLPPSTVRAVVEKGRMPGATLSSQDRARHRNRDVERHCEGQEGDGEDDFDYISQQPGLRFPSPSSAPSTSSSSSSSSSDESGEDESEEFLVRDRLAGGAHSPYAGGYGGEYNNGKGMGLAMGIGIHVLDAEERALYQEIMEEFELGY
ncbi:hypothetical protein B2J93_5169 [Marssonina coronariae]|uniref:Nitrogen regulatory protein areA GATA-like domain-containing protein n=1 Tax=Diplocarpon coronariae TaxID=2795749 RepID=A0A218ZGG1_9HELO|nr:hypothetical protein B2J93_5169 [Marssonina coronariae]